MTRRQTAISLVVLLALVLGGSLLFDILPTWAATIWVLIVIALAFWIVVKGIRASLAPQQDGGKNRSNNSGKDVKRKTI